uniref:Secreted protein n=1 Tax=Syphacia muris TaxID=451379 RepID=A0A0N5ACI9_9BILA
MVFVVALQVLLVSDSVSGAYSDADDRKHQKHAVQLQLQAKHVKQLYCSRMSCMPSSSESCLLSSGVTES